MIRTKLIDRKLPTYTKGEEIFNMVSHIVGGVLGIVATVLCVVIAGVHGNVYGVISGAIFGVTMILLYTMSSIYHGLNPKSKAKKVMQILDHCSIFLLIAGSYTPFCLCTLRTYDTATGWVIFGIIWAMAVIGIILNSIDLKTYKKFSMICYLIMGWCIIVKFPVLPNLLGTSGCVLLVTGGVIYTIGAILYGFRKKTKIYAFNISFMYFCRKLITFSLYIIICYVIKNKSRFARPLLYHLNFAILFKGSKKRKDLWREKLQAIFLCNVFLSNRKCNFLLLKKWESSN